MNQFFAIVLAGLACLLAGCAAPGDAANAGASGAGGASGITVFGTMDAGVSGYKNR